MPAQISPHPEWALKHKQPKTELRHINGYYYLYAVTSVYDKEKRRARKVTGKLLGKITEEQGFIPSEKHALRKRATAPVDPANLAHREYGLAQFVVGSTNEMQAALARHFPDDAPLLLAMAYCRLGWQAPIKNIPFLLARSALPEALHVRHTGEKIISARLRAWGAMRQNVVAYMKEFLPTGDIALIDATDILCKSRHISLARKGYNARLDYQPQVSLLYLYSTTKALPVFYRLLPGNIREISTLKHTIDECGLQDTVIIADKGFFSKNNLKELTKHELRYILPLKRNNTAIVYHNLDDIEAGTNYFLYHKRFIYYHRYVRDGATYCLFLDGMLREQEKTDYLTRITTHPEGYSHEDFLHKRRGFGTIAMITNLDTFSPEQIYRAYKSRGTIEQMFDWLKNVLDADSAYMQNEEALQGWMFVNHLALQIVAELHQRISGKELTPKYSIRDVLLLLTDIRQIRIGDVWYCAEVTSSTKSMLRKLGIDIT
jgi:hypothetical protein